MGWLLHYEGKDETRRPIEYVVLLDKKEVNDVDEREWLQDGFVFSRKAEVTGDLGMFPLETVLVPE